MIEVNLDIMILVACIVLPITCLIVTLFFIFKRISNISSGSAYNNRKYPKHAFEDEIAINIVCQQLDAFLLKTIDEIEKNRIFIRQYLDRKNRVDSKKIPLISEEVFGGVKLINQNNISNFKEINDKITKLKDNNTSTHAEYEYDFNRISDLVRSGLTSKKISETTKIPQSEVDLYIKLHLKEDQKIKKAV